MTMIKKIVLENFMSHSWTELELAAGLTVLVGPNNCGKSAVVEAIRTVCENSAGDFMVRHGQKQCRVVIETDDGHVVEWKRDKAVVSYTIDGREIHRLGGGVPEELHALLKLPMVESPDGKDQFDIHIARQKSPLFLLDRPGRESAMFFASSSDAALMMQMQAKHKQRVTERKRDENQLAKSQQHCQQLLESLQPIPQVDESLRKAEGLYEEIRTEAETSRCLSADIAQLTAQMEQLRQTQERYDALKTLPALPELSDTLQLETLLADILLAELASARGHERCEKLSRLPAVPDLDDSESLAVLCEQLQARTSESERLTAKTRNLSRLTVPPELDDFARLAELIMRYDTAFRALKRVESKLRATHVIGDVPELVDVSPLSARIAELIAAVEGVLKQCSAVENVNAELRDSLAAIEAWAEANPTCPVCGGVVDAEHLMLAGGHEHA